VTGLGAVGTIFWHSVITMTVVDRVGQTAR
jgi:hypothetical protein